jgi:uncharacterized protein
VKEIIIQPETGFQFIVKKGQTFSVIDLEGKQVADFVAFNRQNKNEKLSTGVTIDNNSSLFLRKSNSIFSNFYNKMLTVFEDTVGKHDLIYPACSPDMYRYQYHISQYHPNCLENLYNALRSFKIKKEEIPNPINVFMNTNVDTAGTISVEEPLSKAGDYVTFLAEMNLVVAVAACSVKESKCNAFSCKPIKIVLQE